MAKESTPPAIPQSTSLAAAPAPAKIYSIDTSQLSIPWLNLVQKSSDTVQGPLGSFVYDQDKPLTEKPGDLLPVIPLEPRLGWKEDYPYNSGIKGRFAWTSEERQTLLDEKKADLIEVAEIPLLIKAPAGATDEEIEMIYMFPLGGEQYAITRFFGQKEGYRATYARLNTFNLANALRGARHTERVWNLSCTLVERANKYFVPKLTLTAEHTPQALLDNILQLSAGAL